MRKLRRLLPGLALLALTVSSRAAEVDKFVPNGSDAVVVVNVRQLTESTVFKNNEPLFKDMLQSNGEAQKALEVLGINPFKDVYAVVVAWAAGKPEDRFVIVEGRFDRAKIEAKSEDVASDPKNGLKVIKHGNAKLFETTGKGGPGFGAILSDRIIVIGPKKELVMDAIDKQAGKKKTELKKEVATLLDKVDSKQSISIVALADGLGAQGQQVQEFVNNLKNITGGVAVSDEVKADIVLAAKDDKGARNVAETLEAGINQIKGLVALMANNQKELAPAIDVLNTVKVVTAGTNVSLKGLVSKNVIAQLEKEAKKKIKPRQ